MPISNMVRLIRGMMPAACREAERYLNSKTLPAGEVRSRLPEYLGSRSWEVRNVGVKLIARLKDPAFYPFLINKVRNNGDAGIVTRNALAAIRSLGLNDSETEAAVVRALAAKYWEAKCEALRTLAENFEASPERLRAVFDTIGPVPDASAPVAFREKNFEVRAAAAAALGKACSPAALPVLKALAADSHWLVRHQAAVALVEIGCNNLDMAAEAANELDSIDIISDGCRADFLLAETVAELRKIAADGLIHTHSSEIRKLYVDFQKGWNRRRRKDL